MCTGFRKSGVGMVGKQKAYNAGLTSCLLLVSLFAKLNLL